MKSFPPPPCFLLESFCHTAFIPLYPYSLTVLISILLHGYASLSPYLALCLCLPLSLSCPPRNAYCPVVLNNLLLLKQIKEDELKVRLRTKSARQRTAAAQVESQDHTMVEELQLDTPSVVHSPPKTPDHQNHISSLEGRLEMAREGQDEREGDGVTMGDKDGGRKDATLTESLNMECDSTFQQIEDIEEIF